jgi:hypothetical protein
MYQGLVPLQRQEQILLFAAKSAALIQLTREAITLAHIGLQGRWEDDEALIGYGASLLSRLLLLCLLCRQQTTVSRHLARRYTPPRPVIITGTVRAMSLMSSQMD